MRPIRKEYQNIPAAAWPGQRLQSRYAIEGKQSGSLIPLFPRGFQAAPLLFCHSCAGRNPAQIERGTRTLQNLTTGPSLHRILLHRSAKRALSMLDSCLRRNGGVGAQEWRVGNRFPSIA
ncbi:MAG: hypothetical protein OXU61_09690 [Gammaproteobacteria bacterium]|nr:hypothetical protein [Gammaproteobacteria bacterium]